MFLIQNAKDFFNNKPSAIKPLGLRILPILEQANISIKNVQPFPLPSKEPWTQNPPRVILDLHKNKKSEVDSHIFKTEFLEIKSAYKYYMSIYTDGSKQDEKVACSVISPNFTDSIRLPDNSSIFTAEAKAIDIALYHIRGGGRVVRRCWVNFQCWGVLLICIIVGQGPVALAVGAGGGCLDIFSLICPFSPLSPSLWETARYRLKYCLKGPLNPKQPTNQPIII